MADTERVFAYRALRFARKGIDLPQKQCPFRGIGQPFAGGFVNQPWTFGGNPRRIRAVHEPRAEFLAASRFAFQQH